MRLITRFSLALLAGLLFSLSANAQLPGQQPRFLNIAGPEGFPVIPVLEGWTRNADGSVAYSFGIINRNDAAIDVPLGQANRIEPAKYDGVQPTHFPPGRSTGVFTVTVPPEEADGDVWWYITSGSNNEELKVPGRSNSGAYELDFVRPRPQGALQPLVGLGEDGEQRAGLYAQIGDYPGGTVRAGEPVVMAVNVTDPADRDPTDPRFGEPLPLGVTWHKYQGPGEVTFARHESTPEPQNPYREGDRRYNRWRPPADNQIAAPGPSSTARVYATFSEPGDYVIWTKVDVHTAPDSSNGDQCCWTNVYQRVTVR